MKLALSFRPHLEPISSFLVAELDRIVSAVKTWAATIETKAAIVTSPVDKSDTVFAPALSVSVDAGRTYEFRAQLFLGSDTTGGQKVRIGGTCAAVWIRYFVLLFNESGNTTDSAITITTLNAANTGTTGLTLGWYQVTGALAVSQAGTLTVDFAQQTANNTSSLLIGSTFTVREL